MDSLAEIIHQSQIGNKAAINRLVEMYHQPALRVAQNILGNSQDGEDAVQDAWILAIRNLNALRDTERFNFWFYKIVKNTALQKRYKWDLKVADISILDEVLQAATENEPEESFEQWLPLAMNALSSKDFFVISLHYFQRLPIADIGQLLEIPEGTVKSRIFHAKTILKKEINRMKQQETIYLPDDFRKVISGMRGEIHWIKIFAGNLKGWSYQGSPIAPGEVPPGWFILGENGLVGEEWKAGTTLAYGEPTWRDLEFSFLVTPIGGGNAQVLFRQDDVAKRYYVFDMLMGWQAIAIRKITHDETGHLNEAKLDVVNYPLRNGTEYAVTIAIRDHSITTYVNGVLINRVTDGSWFHGKIGLTIWQAKTLFRDIQVRLLN